MSDRVGEYEINAKIAEGGMGAVYAATHPVIGKKAAIKVLKRSLCTNHEVVERFVDEARAVNRIGHDNIVDVFAFGVLADGRSYFVMEWLEGRTLFQHIQARDLSTIDRIEILDQLSDALHAAHEKGIVHRDIKPENVFLVQERDRYFVKLLDFGVAKLGLVSKHASESVSVVGTPAYISPEQASAQDVDRMTDVYSLGVIAFELFCGRRPFEAEGVVEMLSKHIHHAPPVPRDLAPNLPPILDALIREMLSKDPKKRPDLDRVREVLAELRVAALLEEDRAGTEISSERPLLVRRYARLSHLSHPMIGELSRGAAWIEAEGRAPSPGTPIAIRFQVDEVAAHVDFAGVVSRFFGGTQKVLVRYDRVAKVRLDRIFSIVATSRTKRSTPDGASNEASEIGAEWQARGTLAEGSGDVRRVTPVAGEESAAITAPPGPTKAGTTVMATKEPASKLGLGAKVLGLTALISVASVSSVTWIALERARTDRSFYVNELGVRTSDLLAGALSDRLNAWKSRLLLAAAGGSGGKFDLGDFEALAICDRGRCESAAGAPLAKDTTARALEGAKLRDLAVLRDDGRLVLSAAAADGRTAAIATVKEDRLLDLRGLPQGLSVLVLDPDNRPLAAHSGIEDHEIVGDAAAHPKSRAGARDYLAPDKTPMLGAWTRAKDLAVVVALPSRITDDAVRVLTRQVLLVALLVLGGAVAVALVFARTMTRRLRVLAKHATRVASGDFSASAEVKGHDEVGQLAGSFRSMTEALKQRDEDVLRIRDKMSEDESEALHRQMSEWLETDLASALSDIQSVVQRPMNEADPLRDLAQRKHKLESLAAQASASLQHALAFASIASRRIDMAATVADAVAYARTSLAGSKVRVELSAPNAVLFPRLDAKESEIREMAQALIVRAAKVAPAGERILVELLHRDGMVVLAVRYPNVPSAKAAARSALEAVRPITSGHGAAADVVEDEAGPAITVGFPVERAS